MRTDGRVLVSMQGIVKRFGAVEALKGVDLELGTGEVLGLVGDNAAGKSTLMKTLTGVHQVALPAFILLMGLVFGSPVRAPAGWKPK